MTDIAPWYYKGAPVLEPPAGYAGYVYKITYRGDKSVQNTYIGSKLFLHKTSRMAPKSQQLTAKGVPRKHKVRIRGVKASDWETYFGSCIPLKALVAVEPPHLFYREILAYGKTKAQVLYMESKLLYCEEVLEKPWFWNNWILSKSYRKNLV